MLNNPIMIGGVSGPSLNWKSSHVPFTSTWESVAYGNGTYVAVNRNGSNRAVYSTDGITWNTSTLPAEYRLEGLAFGNGKFVAVDRGSNQAVYSTDGINWTATTLPASASWQDVTYGGGKFVAIASNYNDVHPAAYSTDGITWTGSSMPSAANWNCVAYGDGKFVAVIDDLRNDKGIAAYSTDGITWTETTVPAGLRCYCLAYGDGKFVALDVEGTSAEGARTGIYSADGINWSTMLMPSAGEWDALAFGDGMFVAICGASGDGSAKAAYSYDGIRWALGSMPETAIWSDVVYGGGKFVAISSFNWVTAYTVQSGNLPSLTNPGTAADLLSGKQLIDGDGNVVTGTMTNRGAVSQSLNAGGSYTIPAGYHNGSGKVTANSLASQTSATATAADIASGKTAWVNGSRITGTASGGSSLPSINRVIHPTPTVTASTASIPLDSHYADTSKVLLLRLYCNPRDFTPSSSDTTNYLICVDIYDPFHWSSNKTNQYVQYGYDSSRGKVITVPSALSHTLASPRYTVSTSGTTITVTIAASGFAFASSLTYLADYYYLS